MCENIKKSRVLKLDKTLQDLWKWRLKETKAVVFDVYEVFDPDSVKQYTTVGDGGSLEWTVRTP